jgi:hypothetical protein
MSARRGSWLRLLSSLSLAACGAFLMGCDAKGTIGGPAGGAGGDGTLSGDAGVAACTSTREYFARQVWAPVMGQICIRCHAPGGIAPANGARFQLMPPGYPGFLEANFAAVQDIAKTSYDGTSVILLKPLGALDHGGGHVLEEGSDEYKALVGLVDRLGKVDSCPPAAAPNLVAAKLLGPAATLRKAAIELVGRLPTPAETANVVNGGEDALPAAIDALLKEPAFLDRLKEIWNDVLLTDRYLSYNGHALNVLDKKDFPVAGDYYTMLTDDVKAKVNLAVAREPLDLIAYVVQNDRPFTQILTADFTVVNDASAAVYNLGTPSADYADYTTLREAKIVSKRDGHDTVWPHAGVLTSPMFLDRFPTTPTNRNRHRARMIYDIFLATDILKIAERPINQQESAKYINPTRDDPTCNQCHRLVDPMAGAFLKFDDYSQADYRPDRSWHPEMFAPGFAGETMEVAEFPQAPQWLAQRIAADGRFPLAVVYTMYRALTGQEPLAYPEDPKAEGYEAALGGWEAQEATLRAISQSFADNGFNLKLAVRQIILSPYFRAAGTADGASPDAAALLGGVGTARLSTPEVLARKIRATTGVPWNREYDRKDWLATDYRILYGGIDSDIIEQRLTTPNGMMAAVQDRMANEVACSATAWDFMQPQGQRFLFRNVTIDDTPLTAPDAIKRNIQYLHAQLLGEDLMLDDPEIARTYQLFADTFAEGTQKLKDKTLNNGLQYNCQGRKNWSTGEDIPDASRLKDDKNYVVRSWMAVVSYLLSDYRFLYE